MKKRIAIVAALLVVTAPVIATLTIPELRERARSRWHVHKLRSDNAETRKAMVATLVAKGPAEMDDVYAEVVAAAVIDVSSRSLFIATREPKPGRAVIPLVPMDSYHQVPTNLYLERALTPVPTEVQYSVGQLLFPGPLLKFSEARSLFVTADDKLVMVIALEGERGEQILAAVEERLRRK